ncbi:cytochrome-c peroxidase [Polaribacter sp. R2A056_3_33]|jgi:cytochrome c peroxidase|uniref:cytochrome-c peroxidase n=1 Tax=unclassified Polaribacter TaxID=196858 RepID=UPI001C500D9D|nr:MULTISPECIES: cytochrome c peroxidase [unclassified Polaribacter]QXP63363.1 cytochrome-c peroxidase [Polaribacter sp. HaHaR_3_91]QXP71357.1 cytochrome-c peroxidase [Polaribacter sp. R2A056_3_33]
MKNNLILTLFICIIICSCKTEHKEEYTNIANLKAIYSNGDNTKWPTPNLDSTVDKKAFKDIGALPKLQHPEYNPFSKEKSKLGKTLFFDPRLSVSGQIACASCHNPELAWTDNSTRSFGHDRQTGARNSMTILNVGFAHSLFWDGRASSLEDQARFPIGDPLEMNEKLNIAVDKIAKIEGYKPLFKAAFGNDTISLQRIQYAIATFERTVNSYKTKFDKFVEGDSTKLNNQEVLGLHLFRTKARCINCHNTPYFSDNQFHNDGQTLFGTKDEDFGRYNVTKNMDDIGKIRTPTLREVARTGPWMHNGHFPSLLDVVQFYNLGNPAVVQKKYLGKGRDSLIPTNSPILKKLNLEKNEIEALIAFMETLSSSRGRTLIPNLPK